MLRKSLRTTIALAAMLATALFVTGPAGAASTTAFSSGGGDTPPVGTILHRYVRAEGVRPAVVAGVLSAPLTGLPEAIARAYLAADPEPIRGIDPAAFRLAGARTLPDGWTVTFLQTHEGLDVVGGTVALRLDAAGRVRIVTSGAATIPVELSTTPAVSSEEAVAAVLSGRPGYAPSLGIDPALLARLVVYANPNLPSPLLAYEVMLPRNLLTLETLRAYVDAQTGALLAVDNLTMQDAAHLANVFEFNPVTSADIPVVEALTSLPMGATELTGPGIEVRNCIDENTCIDRDFMGMMFSIHFCEIRPDATTNMSGDFLDIVRPVSDTEAEDNFAEVQMYYHAAKAYAAFRVFAADPGFTLDSNPLVAVVNMRMPDFGAGALCTGGVPPPGSVLGPFDNAMFTPAGSFAGFPPEDWILFGQGGTRDFSYDGDVVYHEFGHAVMYTASAVAGVGGIPDTWGIDPSPGGLNEGYPDYFSSAITGDPEVGEYAGSGFGSSEPSGAIRSLLNTNVCPDHLVGESHEDAKIWGASLWAIRAGLSAGDRPVMDVATYTAMSMLTQFADFEMASTATLGEIATSIGMPERAAALLEFEARGLTGCNNRVMDILPGEAKEMLYLSRGTGTMPGPVQFRYVVPQPAGAITVDIQTSAVTGGGFGGPGKPDVKLLVLPGDAPISWVWGAGGGVHNAESEGDVTFALLGTGTGTVTGNFPVGPYHLQLVNAGSTVVLLGIQFFSGGEPIGGTDSGVGPTDSGAPATDSGATNGDGGGCGCRVAPDSSLSAGGASLLIGLVLAAALMRRQRAR